MMTRKNPLDPRFGEYLKFLRQRAKVTLEKLALESQLDVARLSRMENADYPAPELPVLKKIARALEVKEGSSEWMNLVEFSIANRAADLYGELVLQAPKGSSIADSPIQKMSEAEFEKWLSPYRRYKLNPHRVLPLTEADRYTREEIAKEGQIVESAYLIYRVSDPRLGNRIELLVADVKTDDVNPKTEGKRQKLYQRILSGRIKRKNKSS